MREARRMMASELIAENFLLQDVGDFVMRTNAAEVRLVFLRLLTICLSKRKQKQHEGSVSVFHHFSKIE